MGLGQPRCLIWRAGTRAGQSRRADRLTSRLRRLHSLRHLMMFKEPSAQPPAARAARRRCQTVLSGRSRRFGDSMRAQGPRSGPGGLRKSHAGRSGASRWSAAHIWSTRVAELFRARRHADVGRSSSFHLRRVAMATEARPRAVARRASRTCRCLDTWLGAAAGAPALPASPK